MNDSIVQIRFAAVHATLGSLLLLRLSKLLSNILISPKFYFVTPALHPRQYSLDHCDHVRHPTCVWMEDQGEEEVVRLAVIIWSILPKPDEPIFPHLLQTADIDVAMGVCCVGKEG